MTLKFSVVFLAPSTGFPRALRMSVVVLPAAELEARWRRWWWAVLWRRLPFWRRCRARASVPPALPPESPCGPLGSLGPHTLARGIFRGVRGHCRISPMAFAVYFTGAGRVYARHFWRTPGVLLAMACWWMGRASLAICMARAHNLLILGDFRFWHSSSICRLEWCFWFQVRRGKLGSPRVSERVELHRGLASRGCLVLN